VLGLGKRQMEKVNAVVKYADDLLRDERLRSDVRSAVGHGAGATRRVRKISGPSRVAQQLTADHELRENLRALLEDVDRVGGRVRRRTSHRLRNLLLVAGGSGAVLAAVPSARRWAARHLSVVDEGANPLAATVEQTIEVDVPVRTAYNQWTQFEEFPRFMEGVEEVRQLDDTLLHWAANVAGRRHEWDARIVEQSPDRRIAWESVGGKETAGAVTFAPTGPDRTRIHLELSYRPDGIEWLGSAVGLDYHRVRGDLERFKDYIEDRGVATGAWRGTVDDARGSS
jgi:uncharacterized membrane protein